MNELDKWTLRKMKSKEICKLGKQEKESCLCRDNVSFMDKDCVKCFNEENQLGGGSDS